MKVLFFGTYRQDFTRTHNIIEGLKKQGVSVIECHESLWGGIEDRIRVVSGEWKKLKFFFRLIKVYGRLLRRYFQLPDYNVMVIGYPGQLDVFLARLLSWCKRRPLVWDILMSMYLVTVERNLHHKNRLAAAIIHFVEYIGLRLPDRLIIEGEEYAQWLSAEYHIPMNRFEYVPLGSSEEEFPVSSTTSMLVDGFFRVVYFGSFLRNHGVDVMVEAARLLKNEADIYFEFIGDGPEREFAMQRAREWGLDNVVFHGYLPKFEFLNRLKQADLCLGAFGSTTHSRITVQNKIYEALIMGKSLLTGDSPALRKTFEPGKHLYTCERTPQAIANSILHLKSHPDLRVALAKQGNEFVLQHYSLTSLGRMFLEKIQPLC